MVSGEQIYWEDVVEGTSLSSRVSQFSTAQMFLFSAVIRQPHRIHYDLPYAQDEGHSDVVVQGPLQGALLVSLITDWMGEKGFLKQFNYQNRVVVTRSDKLVATGVIRRKWVDEDDHLVELEVWGEKENGQICVPGSAVVILPTRYPPN